MPEHTHIDALPSYVTGTSCSCSNSSECNTEATPPDPNKQLAQMLNKHRWRRAVKKIKPKSVKRRRKKKAPHAP